MSDKEQLSVDVQRLHTWGAIKLPGLAAQYTVAANHAYRTASYDSLAYLRNGHVPAAFKAWIEYRNLLQSNVMRETAVNLIEIGKSMERYAFALASEDQTVHDELIEIAQQDLSETDRYLHVNPDEIDPESIADSEPFPPPKDSRDFEGEEESARDGNTSTNRDR